MRVFWAVVVPEEVRREIDRDVAPLRERWPQLRWTRPEGWHLTLAFLGEVDPGQIADLCGSVAAAPLVTAPVDIALASIATPKVRPGLVWIPAVDNPALDRVAEAVRDASDPIAHADRRHPFTGHVTLARVPQRLRNARGLVREVAAAYAGRSHRWTAMHVELLSSHRSGDGMSYRTEQRIPLPAT